MSNNHFVWTIFNKKFSVQIPHLAFTCFAIILCIGLANWQWQRAQAADSLFKSYQLQESRPAATLSTSPAAYERVSAEGDIENYFFLDNQIYQGMAGWHVLAEVHTRQFIILVDLGWVAKQDKLQLEKPLPQHIAVQGLLREPQKGFMLQGAQQDPKWPKLQQQIDIPLLSEHFGYDYFPFVLYAENQIGDLKPTPIMMENKYYMHMGYAIQWLLIGAVFLIGFFFFNRSERNENE